MRIRLKKGMQKRLIEEAKKELSLKELAQELGISEHYLRVELRREQRLISEEVYSKLCSLAEKDFNSYILERLEDNWGMSKGGENSSGSTIKLIMNEDKEKLAELIGAILGDGNINISQGGVYQVKIAGDINLDKDYHLDHLGNLCKSLFNIVPKEIIPKRGHGRFLCLTSKELVNFLIQKGMKAGHKIKNKVSIPSWILSNRELLKLCLKGLFDTDGSIYRMSKKNPNLLRIDFTSYNLVLLNDVKNGLEKLGIKTSKIIDNKKIFISSKEAVERYLNEIGFANQKHLRRLKNFILAP